MQAPARPPFRSPRTLGMLATLFVVVVALVVVAIVLGQGRDEADLGDQAGVVERWSFAGPLTVPPARPYDEPLERAPDGPPPGAVDGGISFVGDTTLEVYWQARPCATGPKVTLTGGQADLRIAIDRRDGGACDDSSELFRLVLETTVPVEPRTVTAVVTG